MLECVFLDSKGRKKVGRGDVSSLCLSPWPSSRGGCAFFRNVKFRRELEHHAASPDQEVMESAELLVETDGSSFLFS